MTTSKTSSNIAILGAGMAGYGASTFVQNEGLSAVCYEKRDHYGGHTSSFTTEKGFVFDEGIHISFTKDDGMQDFFAEAVGQEYETVQAKFNNYWNGYWIKHPVQVNLKDLPEDLLIPVLKDFFEAYHNPTDPATIDTFADWLIASYGRTFAETFPMTYGKKYHTTDASNMDTDWLGPRLYTPEPEEVLHGLLSDTTPDVHYIDHIRYPKEGGFSSYLEKFPTYDAVAMKTNHRVVGIDPNSRVITFADGSQARHETIISSIPLPVLIPMIEGVPEDVREAASRLACSTCVTVSLGVDRTDLSDAHLSYFYDLDVSFSRLSFPHMLSPQNTPEGTGSIQAEVYFSEKYKPLTQPADELIPVVIDDLIRTGVLREDDTILDQDARVLRYANVIFDLDRAEAVETVHGYLDDIGIAYCGRYGDWGYMWTDESFRSGERAAERVLSRKSVRA
jgi:protoporphyrinogen oxidase